MDAVLAGLPEGLSVGKALGSWILPTIQRCTREMYWQAGTLIGTLSLLSQVYVWDLPADITGQDLGLQIARPV